MKKISQTRIPVASTPTSSQHFESNQNHRLTTGIRVSFIDVGKGDCILLQADESAALIDTGYDKTSDDVLAYLRKCNVNHLEFLLITHYDRDHVEGFGALRKNLSIGNVYLPAYDGSDKNYWSLMETIDELGVSVKRISENLTLSLGNTTVDVIHSGVKYIPASGKAEGNDNDLSLVTTLVHGSDSYLFTGDLEEEGIKEYLKVSQGHFDVIKMPHHGQKSSFTDDLLEEVRPKIAVITDSSDEPADKKVLKLVKEIGADVYSTGTNGTIVISSSGGGDYLVAFC